MLTTYQITDMVYHDYQWEAYTDHNRPRVIMDFDHAELNRSQGYEMLFFMNSLLRTWGWDDYPLPVYQHLEKIIRIEVPARAKTYSVITRWIETHYNKL
jgi:hypothetical protein